MVHNFLGFNHLLNRGENYIDSKSRRMLDKMICIFGISGPLLTLPQLIKILIEKSAGGVSLISWSAYLIGAIVWFVYGIAHKAKPIIITYAAWILIDLAIVAGILIYR